MKYCADHAFANPSGRNYQAEPAKNAWEKALAFLEEHLKGARIPRSWFCRGG